MSENNPESDLQSVTPENSLPDEENNKFWSLIREYRKPSCCGLSERDIAIVDITCALQSHNEEYIRKSVIAAKQLGLTNQDLRQISCLIAGNFLQPLCAPATGSSRQGGSQSHVDRCC